MKCTIVYSQSLAGDDEISFDPDDIITNIEEVCMQYIDCRWRQNMHTDFCVTAVG